MSGRVLALSARTTDVLTPGLKSTDTSQRSMIRYALRASPIASRWQLMANMLRYILHGSGANEEFAVQMTYQLDNSISVDVLGTIVAAFATEFTGTAKTNLLAMLATDQKWDTVSGYFYATTPNDPATYVAHTTLTTWAGTGGAAGPLQLSMCMTTHSAYAGASNRGRMYLPATGITTLNHLFPNTACDNAVAAAQGLLQQGWATIMAHSAVTSALAVVFSPKKGTGQKIVAVSADNRPDIQRRRAASQTVTYVKQLAVTTA
jgi:hypothetical protein